MHYYNAKYGVLFMNTYGDATTVKSWVFEEPSDLTTDELIDSVSGLSPDYDFRVPPQAASSYDLFVDNCNATVAEVFVQWFRELADSNYGERLCDGEDDALRTWTQYPNIADALHAPECSRPNETDACRLRYAVSSGIANAVYRMMEILVAHTHWCNDEFVGDIYMGFEAGYGDGMQITFEIEAWDTTEEWCLRYECSISHIDWLNDQAVARLITDIFVEVEGPDA